MSDLDPLDQPDPNGDRHFWGDWILKTAHYVRRSDKFTAELKRVLGEPQLVTDPTDGITRPTWTLEIPLDKLTRICQESNVRAGFPGRDAQT